MWKTFETVDNSPLPDLSTDIHKHYLKANADKWIKFLQISVNKRLIPLTSIVSLWKGEQLKTC